MLRLRGRATLGATFISVVATYAEQLDQAGGRLYLAGVDPGVMAQLDRTRSVAADGPVRLYGASEMIGDSSLRAYQDARSSGGGPGRRVIVAASPSRG